MSDAPEIKSGSGYTDDDVRRVAGVLHSSICGWNCYGHGIMQSAQDEKYRQAADAALRALAAAGRLRLVGADRFAVGDRAAIVAPGFFPGQPAKRVEGTVIRVADDGMVTIEVPQEGPFPMQIMAQAADFAKVEDGAGRLLPADTRTEIEWGWRPKEGATPVRYDDRDNAEWFVEHGHGGQAVKRPVWVGPWVLVDPPKEQDHG